MDFDAKYREKFSSSNTNIPFFLHENYLKHRDDQFSIEGALPSSKVTNNFFLQDHLQPLESIDLNNGLSSTTSSNALIPIIQTNFLESFDNPTFGLLPTYDFYETKPTFGNHHATSSSNGVLIPLMENFNQSESGVGILGHSQMMNNNTINMINPSSQSYNNNPFGFFEFGAAKYRPSDEDSCTTLKTDATMVANSLSTTTMMTTRTNMVRKGGRGRKKKPNVVKGQWTIEEDRLLTQLVERYGVRKWSQIAQLLNGRIGKQCRERWHNHLRPDIKKDLWSEEEDRILIKAHTEIGNKWAEIAKKLPGRTENSIKNHWNATKRRQFSKRKCRTKFPRQSSLLQEYIKSLTPETINAGCRKKPPSIHSSETPAVNNSVISRNDKQTVSSNSSSSDQLGLEFDFSGVPDFNFDAPMFEESSIDSLLDYAPSNDHQQQQGQCSFDIMNNDALIEVSPMMQPEVKCELDLVEMINQVNL